MAEFLECEDAFDSFVQETASFNFSIPTEWDEAVFSSTTVPSFGTVSIGCQSTLVLSTGTQRV